MKVRELVAGSVFTPGAARASAVPPRVTIILPTFRRGDSGLLGRAIDSLLGQSFDDFELIVVDDASTDSTVRVIADAMRRDPRVSVVRHARNIGLPAVSEYEGFLLARGSLISFAFDDTVLYRHGLRRLVREAERVPGALIAGYVKAFGRSPTDGSLVSEVLGRDARESDLLATNVIPNNAVLAPKELLEEVGLYDPHVSLARLCDYDLWLRVRRRRRIQFVGMCVGEEHGPATGDSLGSTYTLDRWLSDDRMRQRRDELLRPENFGDVDVFDDAAFASARSRAALAALVEGHVRSRPHLTAPSAARASEGAGVPRILVIAHPLDASVQLVFEAMRDVPGLHVRLADPHRSPLSELAAADALVVSRSLVDHADWVRGARAAGLAVYYYLDDNLPLMAQRGELDTHREAEFAITTMRREVARVDGVLTSTEALAENFRAQGLHDAVWALPLAVPRVVAQDWPMRRQVAGSVGHDSRPTFAMFVGAHRLAKFRRHVLPAFRAAARTTGTPIRVLVPEPLGSRLARLSDDDVELKPFAPSSDYFVALRDLDLAAVDALVVPDARTANSEFKTVHPFVSAAAVGASLVISATGPYAALRGEAGVTLVDDSGSADDWAAAFASVIGAVPVVPRSERGIDTSLLASRFSPSAGAELLLAVIAEAPTPPEPERRTQQLADWLAFELARTRSSMHGWAHLYALESAASNGARAHSGLTPEVHSLLRNSRRLNALGGVSSPLARFDASRDGRFAGRGRERVELGAPLDSVPYAAYRVTLAPGRYATATVTVWADGAPGDLLGMEIVDPNGRIVLHTVAALPRDDEPVDVVLDVRKLKIVSSGPHEMRVFARTRRPAFLLEAVDRGPLNLRRPRARPFVTFTAR